MKYLGKELGLYPTTKENEAYTDALMAFVTDFIAEGRLVFHAKCFTESFYTQQEETKGHIKWFEDERLPKFLQYFETVLAYNAKSYDQGFVIGECMTYGDIAVWHTIEAAASQFPRVFDEITKNMPLVVAFRNKIASQPKI